MMIYSVKFYREMLADESVEGLETYWRSISKRAAFEATEAADKNVG